MYLCQFRKSNHLSNYLLNTCLMSSNPTSLIYQSANTLRYSLESLETFSRKLIGYQGRPPMLRSALYSRLYSSRSSSLIGPGGVGHLSRSNGRCEACGVALLSADISSNRALTWPRSTGRDVATSVALCARTLLDYLKKKELDRE